MYKGELISEYEADLVVDGKIVVEIKSISRLNSIHEAQAIHYLTATGLQLALLVNFGAGSLEYRRVIKSEKTDKKNPRKSVKFAAKIFDFDKPGESPLLQISRIFTD